MLCPVYLANTSGNQSISGPALQKADIVPKAPIVPQFDQALPRQASQMQAAMRPLTPSRRCEK